MKGTLAAAALVLITACGPRTSDGDVSATIGWTFNFKDWTCAAGDMSAACLDQIRTCANQGPTTPSVPYNEITQVRIRLDDPQQQIQGMDQTYGCGVGQAGKRVEIRGMARQVYSLTIEGLTEGGAVFYRYFMPEFDLSIRADETFELPVAVGEVRFMPELTGVTFGDCPGADVTYAWGFYADAADATPVASGVQAACSGSFADFLTMREIPVTPTPSGTGNWINSKYVMRITAVDSGGAVSHCVTNSARVVNPGDNSPKNDELLAAGDGCL